MTTSIKLLETDDTTNLDRQIATFSATGPIVVLIVCVMAMVNGGLNAVYIGFMIICGIGLANVFRWHPRVMEAIRNRRPLQMKVYFSKKSWGPFADLQATLYDPRRFDPFKQAFRPKWDLVSPNFDSKAIIGEAQDCLVYVDRDSGKVVAFATGSGALFPKPYLMPWKKVDTSALIQSGQAVNFEAND